MSDAVLQELIVRLATDEGFAGAVRAEPTTLDAYDLSDEERATLLGLGADSGPGASGLAERQSKSSLLFMGAGHHVEGHVNLPGHGLDTHTHTPGPIHPDAKIHDAGLGADKHFAGPITHDDKVHPVSLHDDKIVHGVGDKWHGGGDLKIHEGLSTSKGFDTGNLNAAKMTGAGGFADGAKIDTEVNGDG